MDALRLLQHLHRGGRFGYFWRLQGRRSEWFIAGNPGEMPLGSDVYWGVHPTTAIPQTNSRGEKAEPSAVRAQIPYVACVNCFFAELDAKDYGGSKDLCRTYIDEKLFVSPSVVIDSGGGFHLYWLLAEPVPVTDDGARDRVDRLQKSLVTIVGGDPGAKDLARVLRVPDTMNSKYSPARRVTVIDGNGYLFDFGELAELIDFHTPISAPETMPAFDSAERSVEWLANYVTRQKPGARNHGLYWAACRAFDDGLTLAQVEAALVKAAMQTGLTDKEARRTIGSAVGRPARKVTRGIHA